MLNELNISLSIALQSLRSLVFINVKELQGTVQTQHVYCQNLKPMQSIHIHGSSKSSAFHRWYMAFRHVPAPEVWILDPRRSIANWWGLHFLQPKEHLLHSRALNHVWCQQVQAHTSLSIIFKNPVQVNGSTIHCCPPKNHCVWKINL